LGFIQYLELLLNISKMIKSTKITGEGHIIQGKDKKGIKDFSQITLQTDHLEGYTLTGD